MIDLREEIEVKLKYAKNLYDNINENDNGYLKSYFLGTIQSYETILKCLENHNIITAPKSIKLSEILDRLNKEHKKTINGNIIFEYKINRNWRYNTDGTPYHLTDTTIDSYYYGKKLLTVIKFNKKMDITILDFGDNFKWLYALWIAGTIIEDDLQDE